jgi:hypothetical protein
LDVERPAPFDGQNPDPVQSNGIRPVWRARSENPGQGLRLVIARMNCEHVTLSFVEPGKDQNVLPGSDPVESGQEGWFDLEPGVGRALVALLGRVRRYSAGSGPAGAQYLNKPHEADPDHDPAGEEQQEVHRADVGSSPLGAYQAENHGDDEDRCVTSRRRFHHRFLQRAVGEHARRIVRRTTAWCKRASVDMTGHGRRLATGQSAANDP